MNDDPLDPQDIATLAGMFDILAQIEEGSGAKASTDEPLQ